MTKNMIDYKWYIVFCTQVREDIMDNFMSKLSQKINAQDVIKANFMADTAEKEHMKKQLQEYDAILQSMRNLYVKQEENVAELKDSISKSDEFTHKECVKVYRNVQALLEEQNRKLDESTQALKEHVEALKAPDMSEEFALLQQGLKRAARSRRCWGIWITILAVANLACMLLIHFGLL